MYTNPNNPLQSEYDTKSNLKLNKSRLNSEFLLFKLVTKQKLKNNWVILGNSPEWGSPHGVMATHLRKQDTTRGQF